MKNGLGEASPKAGIEWRNATHKMLLIYGPEKPKSIAARRVQADIGQKEIGSLLDKLP